MEIILYSGVGIFFIAAIVFYLTYKGDFKSPFFVSFLTMCSYLIMLNGIFIIENSDGESIYWSRWIGYAISCSILMYTISKKLKFSNQLMLNTIGLNILVMITGAFSSIFEEGYMIFMFTISSIAYIFMIYPIITSKIKTTRINSFIFFGWSLFPVIFLLSHEGFGFIENELAFAIYLGIDVFTKIVFYLVVEKDKFKID